MTAFVLHVVRDRRTCAGSVTTRRMIHLPTCKYAGLARFVRRIGLDELHQLWRGGFSADTVPTKLCRICQPGQVAVPRGLIRRAECMCKHWRVFEECPVHGPAIAELKAIPLTRR